MPRSQPSLGKPRARLGLTCFRKKLHWPFAKTRARERQHLCLPSRIADDGDLLKVVAVAEEKVRIDHVSLRSQPVKFSSSTRSLTAPAIFFDELGLHSIEFGSLQLATHTKDKKTISVLFEIGAHACLVWHLWKELFRWQA
jgi:hypothetical protein